MKDSLLKILQSRMYKKHSLTVTVFLVYVLFALIFTFLFTRGLKTGELILIHDDYVLMDKTQAFNAFNVYNPNNFGYLQTTNLIVTLFTRLYYLLLYTVGFTLQSAQLILYILKLFILGLLPFIGFRLIVKNIFSIATLDELVLNQDNKLTINWNLVGVFLVAIFYALNHYTLVYWHGNNFELTLLICYSLAPLTFYQLHQTLLLAKPALLDYIKATLLLSFMLFAFYLAIVFLVFVALFLILESHSRKLRLGEFLTRLILLIVLALPLAPLFLLIPYEMLFSGVAGINVSGGETYNLLSGGFLYPLFMWFSWGIYTYWEHKSIYTFASYFDHLVIILPPFLLYLAITYHFYTKRYRKQMVFLCIIFLLFLFFIKGAQEPFGDLFKFGINNVSVFRVFRSPDNKLGFALVLTLCLIALSLLDKTNKKLFYPILMLLIATQSYLFITGKVIKGENTADAPDRFVQLSAYQQQIIEYINTNTKPHETILLYPPVEFGHFILGSDKLIGQDPVSKQLHNPVVFLSEYSSMTRHFYKRLKDFYESGDVVSLHSLPVNYVLVRNDIDSYDYDADLLATLDRKLVVSYSNSDFRLYKTTSTGIVDSTYSNSLNYDNPTLIYFDAMHINGYFTLRASHNPKWHFYTYTGACKSCLGNFMYKLFIPMNPSFTPMPRDVTDQDFNTWSRGNTNNVSVVYFALQSYFWLALFTALSYMTFLTIVLIYTKFQQSRFKE